MSNLTNLAIAVPPAQTLHRPSHSLLSALVLVAAVSYFVLSARDASAGSATWNLNPGSGVWNTATNWTPATIPNGPDDIATFGVSNVTGISNDTLHDIEVNGIVFTPGASAFTITFGDSSFFEDYRISGVGITNNSGITQNFAIGNFGDSATLLFTNSATAGERTVFTAGPNCCGTSSYVFQDTSTAGSATLIANFEGTIVFTGDSTGGAARIKLFGGGFFGPILDISAHNSPGVTIGSLEGTGTVNLGANNLTIDSDSQGNSQSKMFSGAIQGAGGSLTKSGRRKLVLARSNAYSGGTTIEGGELLVSNQRGSGTGSGAVKVAAGRLGGTGIIAGPVTVGASRAGAELAPGDEGAMGTLTLLSTLTFRSHGAYLFDVNSNDATGDQLIANGVTIKVPNAELSITDLAGGILTNAELYDVGNGTWSATSSLSVARAGQTATLLPSGKVLVAGGNVNGSGLSEVYDPVSGTWADTGSLNVPRSGQTATLLPDGEVLVAGGNLGFGPTASAELYDPVSGIWTPTGNMTSARYYHTATLLSDGKVLVVGSPGVSTAELYDPVAGSWSTTGSPITSRWSHTATLLPSGEVLVAGGSSGIGTPIKQAELYEPATGTWTATGNLIKARQVHTATLLPNNKVLVAGGQGTGITELTSAELYDSANGTWALTGSLAIPRAYHTATLLLDGRVTAAGGNNGINFMEPSVELYDPANGTWSMTGSLYPGRYSHTATLLPDGSVLVAGGVGQGLPIGAVLTLINNTSANPISGTFSNLPDRTIIIVAGTKCQVNYSGGDGNDLTLTAVP